MIFTIILTLGLFSCSAESNYSDIAERNIARAMQLGNATLDVFLEWELYNETNPTDWEVYLMSTYNPFSKEVGGESTVWHYTAVMAMLNRLSDIAPSNKKAYYEKLNTDFVDELAWFRGTGNITNYNGTKSVTLYAVHRSTSGRNKATVTDIQAVYDDQMWLIREYIDAYFNTGSEEYLYRAEQLTASSIDGWDTSLDPNGNEYGGITWGSGYGSKHTCSNAPFIAPLVKLAEIYKDSDEMLENMRKEEYYLYWAKKINEYSYRELRNSDYTYGDAYWSLRTIINDPLTGNRYQTLDPRTSYDAKRYTYNTGAMISGQAELYRYTGEAIYLEQAKRSAEAAYHFFGNKNILDGYVLYPIDTYTTWFNLVLLTGFIDLYPFAKEQCDIYIDSFQKSLDYAYDNFYLDGFLPRNLLIGWQYGNYTSRYDMEMTIMDAAANAEMYAMLAQHELRKKLM